MPSYRKIASAGLQTSSPADQLWDQDSPGVLDSFSGDSIEGCEFFGFALAAKDLNGDGYDDLAIGVPLEDIGDFDTAGAVNILYGSSPGLQATGTGGPDDQFWHQNSAGVDNIVQGTERFGDSLG